MKRTLFEILAATAVIVLILSLHHQVARLKTQTHEVEQLRGLVQDTLAKTSEEPDARREQARALESLLDRIHTLEVQIADASQGRQDTEQLREALQREVSDRERFRAQIANDVARTRNLVDNYVEEMRSNSRVYQSRIEEARRDIEIVADRVMPDRGTLTRSMLAPTVQLNGDDTVGSGTLVFSGLPPRGSTTKTYVLTSYHVVRNILADTPSAKSAGIQVTIWRDGGVREDVRADLVQFDARIDAALLELRGDQRYSNLARVLPRNRTAEVDVWQHIVAVGCPLGNDPIPTSGAISSLRNRLNGTNYWMINAPTYFGNSGGGVYLGDSFELVGVFSKIYTHGKSTPVVIPHMGLCTPVTAVREWLEQCDMGWVLDTVDEYHALASPPK